MSTKASERYLGVDVQMSALVAVALDGAGNEVGEARVSLTPDELRNPEALWSGFIQILGSFSGQEICGIGFSGPDVGGFILGKQGQALQPGTLPGDTDAAAFADYLETTARRSRAITGSVARPDMLGPALLALRDSDVALFEECALALSHKDYLIWRLTGRAVTDVATASGTLFFAPPEGGQWAGPILKSLSLSSDLLPEVFGSGSSAGELQSTAAAELDLKSEVFVGSAGSMATAAGLGLCKNGEACLNLFDEATLLVLSDAFLPNPMRGVDARSSATPRLFAHLKQIGPAEAFDDWGRSLQGQASGGQVPYFVPGLEHGGALAGLTPQTSPEVLAQSIAQGFAFEISEAFQSMKEIGDAGGAIALAAPADLARRWGPMLASALDCPIQHMADEPTTAARACATWALGATQKAPQILQVFQPNATLRARFEARRPGLAGLKSRLTHS